MLTYDDMTKLIVPEEFGTDDVDDVTDSMEVVAEQLGIKYEDYAYGVTKFVIFANEEEVYKIPFNGEFSYCYDSDESDEGEYVFDEFQYVHDYCALEADVYDEAVMEDIEKMFAETRFVGYTKDRTPLYASERIVTFMFDDDKIKKASNEGRSKLEKMRKDGTPLSCRIDGNWLANAIDCYGEEYVERTLQFLHDKGIDDFHSGNMGYRKDGTPCFIDYSGFNEC